MRSTTASIPLLVLVLALAGCGGPSGEPTSGGSPGPTAGGTPTPGATGDPGEVDPLDTVTWMLLQSDHVYFCDDIACGVDGFRYDGTLEEAVTKLTGVFGSDPEVERIEDGPYVSESYDWGGFLLYTSTDGGVRVGIGVHVTAARVEGVRIETEHGVRVGTRWADAAAVADSVRSYAGEADDIWEARFGSTPTGHPDEFTAVVAYGNARGGGGPVTLLTGPITIGELPGG